MPQTLMQRPRPATKRRNKHEEAVHHGNRHSANDDWHHCAKHTGTSGRSLANRGNYGDRPSGTYDYDSRTPAKPDDRHGEALQPSRSPGRRPASHADGTSKGER